MTWADFYLICFAVGFFFSLLSFLAGGLRWHLHLPHFSACARGRLMSTGRDTATAGGARTGSYCGCAHKL